MKRGLTDGIIGSCTRGQPSSPQHDSSAQSAGCSDTEGSPQPVGAGGCWRHSRVDTRRTDCTEIARQTSSTVRHNKDCAMKARHKERSASTRAQQRGVPRHPPQCQSAADFPQRLLPRLGAQVYTRCLQETERRRVFSGFETHTAGICGGAV